jgi:hypothetical protein
MGEAKRRGTYEERKAAALVRDGKIAEAVEVARAAGRKGLPTDGRFRGSHRRQSLLAGALMAFCSTIRR